MSTEPTSLTAPTTLDAVIHAVLARTDIGLRRRQEMASAVRVMSRLLGQPATDIPADPRLLRGRVAQITAAGAGLSPARWRNIKSLFNAALTITGASATGRRSTAALRPEWRDLLARIPDRYDRAKLSKLARFCSLRALTPEAGQRRGADRLWRDARAQHSRAAEAGPPGRVPDVEQDGRPDQRVAGSAAHRPEQRPHLRHAAGGFPAILWI